MTQVMAVSYAPHCGTLREHEAFAKHGRYKTNAKVNPRPRYFFFTFEFASASNRLR